MSHAAEVAPTIRIEVPMPRGSLRDVYNPNEALLQAVEQFFAPLADSIQTVHVYQNSKGLFLKLGLSGLPSGEEDCYLLSLIDGKATEESGATNLAVGDL